MLINQSYNNTKGQTLVEAILALAVFGFITAALVTMVLGSFAGLQSGAEHVQAQELALEGIEAVKSIRDGAWNELIYNQSGVGESLSQWQLLGEGTTETIGQFTRTITFDAVCRDNSDNITTCPGSYTDPHTLRITSSVSWEVRPGITDAVQEIGYITNWESYVWPQSNWSGGSGQSIWSDITRYDSDNSGLDISTPGQLTLATGGGGQGCGDTTWSFDTAGDYTYDPAKIEVTTGLAQLKEASPWWDTGYLYRQQVTVTTGANSPSGTYNGYTVRVNNVDTATLVGTSKLQNDCDDLRIVHWNGSSFDELDRHVLNCNTGTSDIRFQLQADIPASSSDTDYYVYYGNPSAVTPPQNLSNVYLWYDDTSSDTTANYIFGRGDDWHGTGGTNSFVWNAAGYFDYDTGDNVVNSIRIPSFTLSERDAYIEMDMYHTNAYANDMTSGVVGRYNASANYGTDTESADHYYAGNRADSPFQASAAYPHDRDIMKTARGTTAMDGTVGAVIAGNQWRKQALALFGIGPTTGRFWDDDTAANLGPVGFPSVSVVTSGTDNLDYQNPGEWGAILAQDAGRVRNILVRRYTEPEPAAALGGEIGRYASDGPTINPTASYEPLLAEAWTSFTETATKNGGEIYYQLTDDDGVTWYYWDGSAWSAAVNPTDYTIASVVNANIWKFPVTGNKINFRAFLVGNGTQQVQLDEVEIGCANLQMEIGTVMTDTSFTSVNLINTYNNPVVITSYQESANSGPASVRVRNVTPTSFEVALQNPSGSGLSSDTIAYLVVEQGRWELNGVPFEAKRLTTSAIGYKNNWPGGTTVTFDRTYSSPIVLHSVMSYNDSNWIASFVSAPGDINNPPTGTQMTIGLNGAEATTSHGAETIGWLAIESGQADTFDTVDFETQQTSDTVAGHDNGCNTFGYTNTYGVAPIVFVAQQKMDGGDGSWGVVCSNSSSQVGVHAEEDQVSDAERSHTTEIFGFLAFAQNFDYSGGGVTLGPGQFVDDTQAEYDAGTYSSTQWNTDHIELTAGGLAGGSGTYTSKIFDIIGSASWDNLSWVPLAPYGKELPDSQATETAYSAGNMNMSGNQLLMHMNETSGTVGDSSGNGYDATGMGAPSPAQIVDDTQTEFDMGTYSNTQWNTNRVELTAAGRTAGTGTYTSIIYDAGGTGIWSNMSWVPSAPYGKELPNNATSEAAYSTGNANMSNNIILLHMNESSGTLADSSGNGHTGTGNNGVTYGVAGKFNTAMQFDGVNDSVTIGSSATLNAVTSFTAMAWVRINNNATNNQTILSFRRVNNDRTWLVYETTAGRGITVYNDINNSDVYLATTNYVPTNGQWFHVAWVVTGTQWITYINGTQAGISNNGLDLNDIGNNFATSLGRRAGNNDFPLGGAIDEFAMYSRVLSATEINNLYRRGAFNIQHQVRSCDDVACVGESFIGPDGTAGTYYSEINNTAITLPTFALTNVPNNRYFQYRSTLTTTNTTITPELRSMTIDYSAPGTGPTLGVAGQFKNGIDFNGTDQYLETTQNLATVLGGTASLSAWIKTTQVGNATMWLAPGLTGIEEGGGTNDVFWGWINASGQIGIQAGDTAGAMSTTAVNDGSWHHVVFTRDAASGQTQVYVDSVLESTVASQTGTVTNAFYSIGRIEDTGGSPVYYDGIMDEFAVFNSVIDLTTVQNLYRRGIVNVRYQVRSCDDSACFGESFVGPDGTAGDYYEELDNSTVNLPSFGITNISDNRYFQYRATLITGDSSYNAGISNTTIDYTITAGGGGGGGSGYVLAGDLISSAFDTGKPSAFQVVEWDQDISTCSPGCAIQLQIQTAPDNAGSPGTWTATWSGPDGDDGDETDYYTVNSGELLSADHNGDQWIRYRVFLTGDGTQTPRLDEIRINYK